MKSRVKDGFAPAQDLFLQVFNAYLVAAFMHWSGMVEIHSSPTNVSTLPSNGNCGKQEKLIYLNNVIGSFVDSFCLKLPDATRKRLTGKWSSNKNPALIMTILFLHGLQPALHQVYT